MNTLPKSIVKGKESDGGDATMEGVEKRPARKMSKLIDKLGERSEPRYRAYSDDVLACSVSVRSGDEEKTSIARVINLSQSGARLKIPIVVSVGQQIHIRFTVAETDFEVSADATIRWAQPAADGQTAFGCVLDESIDSQLLEELAEAGILERRQDERIPVSIPVHTRQELSDTDADAEIQEYSRGGLRLISEKKIDLDGRLMISFPEVCKTIIVRPVWQREIDERFQVGCRLLERSDSAIISSLVESPETIVNSRNASRPWIWCGLGVAITWFILKLFKLA